MRTERRTSGTTSLPLGGAQLLPHDEYFLDRLLAGGLHGFTDNAQPNRDGGETCCGSSAAEMVKQLGRAFKINK